MNILKFNMNVLFLIISLFSVFLMGGSSRDDMSIFVQNTKKNLQNNLTKFADEILGLSNLENIYVSNVTEKYQQFDVLKNVDSIMGIVSSRLQNAVDVLYENKKHIEDKYRGSNMYNFKTNCCDMQHEKYFSNVYGKKKKMCFTSAGLQNHSKIPKNSSTFFHNQRAQFDGIVLQYFGDLDGHYLQYPAAPRFCSGNEAKDPRFENWYVCTATPYKKNIMLVIDNSGSMVMTIGGVNHPDTPTREYLAKEAANTVLNTLSPKDYVGIVTFGKEAKTAPGCLGVKMAQATEENKGLLRNFINSTEAIEPTTLYETAFAKAFQLFNASKKDNPEQFMDSLDMILFLTDGVAHDRQPEILEKIASGQSWMDNKVHIFVYGLGQELLFKTSLDDKMKLLYQIADQNNQIMSMPGGTGNIQLQWPAIPSLINRTSSVGPAGNITFISDSDGYHLKDIMGKYYTQFPLSKYPQLTISLPHSDKLSGVVVTLGLPTIDDNGNFFGVTAVDVSYEQMFYEVVHFKQKQHSYAFIVGSGGNVLSHPYLSLPKDNVTQPVFYSVQQLEPSLSTDALTNISKGIEGEEAAAAVVWTDDRSRKQLRNAVFYIRPVSGFEQNYTIVFVIFKDDLHSIFSEMINNRTDIEIISRVHNTTDYSDDDLCSVNGNILQDTSNSTVMFSRDISRHLTCQSSGVHQKCMYGSSGQNDSLYEDNNSTLLQGSLSVDMFVTEAVSQYWSHSVDVQRRYIGTEGGIFRINPGIPVLDILYDPREDSWYNEAVQNSDVFLFNMESVIGQPDIVSIRSTYETNSTSGSVGGVIGSEIHHHHLNTLLMNVMAECLKKTIYSCYIVDDRGFVIYKYQTPSVKEHITKLLPRIAYYLIQSRNLEINWCKDLNTEERHLSYRLVTNGQGFRYNGSNVCGDYDFVLSQITHTNLYLLVDRNITYCPPGSVYKRVPVCHCTEECKTCDVKQLACQCPCVCKKNQVAGCDRHFDMNSGYRPCAEKRKGLTLQRLIQTLDQNPHQNVSKCKRPCITNTNKSHCESDSNCTWCQSGYYKTYPACVQHCIRDRVEVKFFTPCVNITDITSKERDQLFEELKNRVVSLVSTNMNFTVQWPKILSNNIVRLFIETFDGSVIPNDALHQLKPAIQVQSNLSLVNITFLAEENEKRFSDLKITLYVRGINFTDKLQHSTTLRQYVHHVIYNLGKDNFIPAVASTITDIWLQNNTISFWITNEAKVDLTEQVKPLLERQRLKSLEFDLLGDNVTVEQIETKGSYNKYCPVDCHNISTEESCNNHHYCHWEETENKCTDNPVLPERLIVTIDFPCLGLYDIINDTTVKDDIIKEFKQKIQNQFPILSSSKVAHSFEYKKGTDTVGSYIQFVIQGRLLDPPVSETVWMLKQHMSWSSNFTVIIPDYNMTEYRSDVKQRTYQDFTNLQIILVIKDRNLEDFLSDHPFNGRQEIQEAISKIAMSHFLPEIAKSVDNVRIYKDYVEFMVSKSPESDIDLRLEYRRLKSSIDKNDTKIILFGKELEIDTDYFTGTFQNVCPRTCIDVFSEVECQSLGGCHWSDKHLCEDNYTQMEKKEIKIVFPCAGLDDLTTNGRNKVLSLLEQNIRRLPLNISHKAIHTFTIGKEFTDSIKFVLQGMSKDPPLTVNYRNLTKFIHDGQITLDIGQNGSSIVGIDTENYDSYMIYLEYSTLKKMTFKEELNHVDKVTRQLNDFLMPDIYFMNGYFNFRKNNTTLILEAQRKNKTLEIDETLDKIRKFISIGGLRIIKNTNRYVPTNVKYRGIYIDKCPNNCHNSSINETTCQVLSGCHLETVDNVTNCTNNPYLLDSLTLQLHMPCNSTQLLNVTEIQETRDDLFHKITNILNPVSNKIVTDIDFKQNVLLLTLQATLLFPYIQRYADKIKHSNLNFGPSSDESRFTIISPGDFTDVEIALQFNTIDFDGMQNSLIATKTDIIESLQRKLESILLAETMKYFHVLSVKDDTLIFTLQKDKNSLISMANQVEWLKKEVNNNRLLIDLPYIRPVTATSYKVKETFKLLCPEKYQPTNTITVLPTMSSVGQANTTGLDYQTTFISPTINMVSVVMVYNSFEVTEIKLQSYINVTANLDICFIPATQLYTAKKKCRLNICIPSINPTVKPTKENKTPNVTMEIPGHYDIGPGEAAGITLASLLGLLLAIGAAVLAYNMKKKASMKKIEAQAREIEEIN